MQENGVLWEKILVHDNVDLEEVLPVYIHLVPST